jgi:energy-coupling factor transporter transmembrane protein EcfT
MAVGAGSSPFAYHYGDSPLHRCPAGIKLLCLFLLSGAAFSSIPGLVVSVILIIAGALVGRIKMRDLLRGSRPLIMLALFVVIFRCARFEKPYINIEDLYSGLVSGLCLIVSFAAGALLFSVTTMAELRRSLGRVETALTHGKICRGKRSRLSLGISLMLGFIPRFFEIWENANLAWEARAGKRGLRRIIPLIPLVTERMMEAAADTALALEAKGV